jgi:hypothetical protein
MRRAASIVLVAPPVTFAAHGAFAANPLHVDSRLPGYRPVHDVSGTVKSVGSDTLNNLMGRAVQELLPERAGRARAKRLVDHPTGSSNHSLYNGPAGLQLVGAARCAHTPKTLP